MARTIAQNARSVFGGWDLWNSAEYRPTIYGPPVSWRFVGSPYLGIISGLLVPRPHSAASADGILWLPPEVYDHVWVRKSYHHRS